MARRRIHHVGDAAFDTATALTSPRVNVFNELLSGELARSLTVVCAVMQL